jgi:hypothetical protein
MCPNGCGEKLFQRELAQHVRAVCPDRKESCECGAQVRYRERNKHKLIFCDLRQVQCKYAPKCKWRGTARDMQVHISETLSTAQKMAKVKGDPFIECLERPYTCWHPPLVAPAEDNDPEGFKLRWTGCGAVFPFGKRAVHDSKECPFRQQVCKLGCKQNVLGYKLEEHYHGKLFRFCKDTASWLNSACPEREVPCVYIISKERATPLQDGEQDPDDKPPPIDLFTRTASEVAAPPKPDAALPTPVPLTAAAPPPPADAGQAGVVKASESGGGWGGEREAGEGLGVLAPLESPPPLPPSPPLGGGGKGGGGGGGRTLEVSWRKP